MSTRRAFDSDALRAAAKKIGSLGGSLGDTGGGITGVSGSAPFGALPSSGGISSALTSFTQSLKKEFAAGAKLVSATETSINAVADDMDGVEDDNARSFRAKGDVQAV